MIAEVRPAPIIIGRKPALSPRRFGSPNEKLEAPQLVLTFNSSRNLGRVWHAGVTAAFTRTASLPVPGTPSYNLHTIVGTGQISRALARRLSCYVSYTAENQTSSGGATTVDVFTGLSQVVGFGLTFSPMPIHVGHP